MKKIISVFFCFILLNGISKAYDDTFEAQKAGVYTIDGQGNEDFWASAVWYDIPYVWLPYGETVAPEDFTGRFKLAWTADVLLVLAEIEDDVFSDQHADPFDSYWEDDCFEVFLDEDHSGGWHESGAEAYNAFAYHISTLYDAVDIGTSGTVLLNDHVDVVITQNGATYTWETAIKIFDDTYDEGGSNNPVTLTGGKEMGLSVAYCDNDGTGVRENFIGAVNVSEEDQNAAWQDADVFGTLTLIDNGQTSFEDISGNENTFHIYPSPAQSFLYIDSKESFGDAIHIKVYSLDGRLMLSNKFDGENTGPYDLYVGMLEQGTYIIQLENNDLNYSQLFHKY
jgi:hypothetical protein